MTENKICLIGAISHSTPIYSDGVRDRFGGGVIYGAYALNKLEVSTVVITCGGADISPAVTDLQNLGAKVYHFERSESNNFANDYRKPIRVLQMKSFIKEPITALELKSVKENVAGIVLCPTFKEINLPLLNSSFFNKRIILFDGGFTRDVLPRDRRGFYPVVQTHWGSINRFAGKVDIFKLSNEDLVNLRFSNEVRTTSDKLKFLAENYFPITILTRSESSTIVARRGMRLVEVPTLKVSVVDPAGAGDVFNASFMTGYLETKDPIKAAAFANAAASMSIAGRDYTYKDILERSRSINGATD